MVRTECISGCGSILRYPPDSVHRYVPELGNRSDAGRKQSCRRRWADIPDSDSLTALNRAEWEFLQSYSSSSSICVVARS
jgi:hypothetical protein